MAVSSSLSLSKFGAASGELSTQDPQEGLQAGPDRHLWEWRLLVRSADSDAHSLFAASVTRPHSVPSPEDRCRPLPAASSPPVHLHPWLCGQCHCPETPSCSRRPSRGPPGHPGKCAHPPATRASPRPSHCPTMHLFRVYSLPRTSRPSCPPGPPPHPHRSKHVPTRPLGHMISVSSGLPTCWGRDRARPFCRFVSSRANPRAPVWDSAYD